MEAVRDLDFGDEHLVGEAEGDELVEVVRPAEDWLALRHAARECGLT